MTRRLHRLRLALLEAVAPPEPVPGGPTVADLLDAIPDPDERQRLTAALVELVALDARRATLTDAERWRAVDVAAIVHRGLLGTRAQGGSGPLARPNGGSAGGVTRSHQCEQRRRTSPGQR